MAKKRIVHEIAILVMWCIFVYHILFNIGFFNNLGIYLYPMQVRAISLILLFGLVLILGSIRGKRDTVPWYDVLMIIGFIISMLYIIIAKNTYVYRLGLTDNNLEVALGIVAIIVTFEVARRASDLSYVMMGVAFVLYAAFNNYIPGFFRSSGSNLSELTGLIWLSEAGMFGFMTDVVIRYLFPFLLFTTVLTQLGGTVFLQRIAFALFGKMTGGSAKVAVALNWFLAMINGSTVASVVMTMPLVRDKMLAQGFSRSYTGGLISVAATAAQFTPPVMGFTAFVMADYLKIPYIQICIAAAIPAFLYFYSLFIFCHLEAVKRGMPQVEMEIPSMRVTFKEGWHCIPGIAILTALLVRGELTPAMSCFWACLALVILGALQKESRLDLEKLKTIVDDLARTMAQVGVICASAGIMVAALGLSSLDFKFSTELVHMVGNQMLPLLAITAVACLVVGGPLPTLPSYILVVLVVTPAIMHLGIPPLVIHMFVFYWALAAQISPPVMGNVFVAAPMVGAGIWTVGWHAMWLGIASYLIPFLFVLRPALLWAEGNVLDTLFATFIAMVSTTGFCIGIVGYGLRKLNWPERVIGIAGGCLLIFPMSWAVWALPAGASLSVLLAISQVAKFRLSRRTQKAEQT